VCYMPPSTRLPTALFAALLLAGPASSTELEEAQVNIETVVQNYVARKSEGGYWTQKAGGKTLRLAFDKVEPATLHRSKDGLWHEMVDLKDAGSGKLFFAEASIDAGSARWVVAKFHWLTRTEATANRAADLKLVAALTAAQRKPGPLGVLPELTLTSLDGRDVFLPECAKPKCLTVVVAPWCPHCNAIAGVLVAMQKWLPEHGVEMRLVVAHDSEDNVRSYAQGYGRDTLLDPDVHFPVGGVPAFIVSTNGGEIVSKQSGAWERETDPARFAGSLGLP
jgi:thiol-disulfide isomerase/thioredoxin